jgi:hypothetical protein
MPSRIVTRERVQHHFTLLGCINFIFVETWIASLADDLHAIAKVIAEANGESSVYLNVCFIHLTLL